MPALLAIETSCDDTSVAVLNNGKILATLTSSQVVHDQYGGIVPELASRAHQKNLIPLLQRLLKTTKLSKNSFDAVAFTAGPGLLGSLLTGTIFAKSFARAIEKPIIAVDHLHGHLMSPFIETPSPRFPYLCMIVSGGHTMIFRVDHALSFTVIGKTRDDAAGEAYDKGAKIMGLPYPGGPEIDRLASIGDPERFKMPVPSIPQFDMSFSGLKTALLYKVRDQLKNDPDFLNPDKPNLADLCASYQAAINRFLISKLRRAAKETGIKDVCIAGGVAANSDLRKRAEKMAVLEQANLYIPALKYCMDNAAMIAIAAWHKFQKNDFADFSVVPYARSPLKK